MVEAAERGGCAEENKRGSKEEAKRRDGQPFVDGWMSIRAKQRETTRSWSPPSMTSCLSAASAKGRERQCAHTHMRSHALRSYEAQQGTSSSSMKQKHCEAMLCEKDRGVRGSMAVTYRSKSSLMSTKMPSQTRLASKAPSGLTPHLPPAH